MVETTLREIWLLRGCLHLYRHHLRHLLFVVWDLLFVICYLSFVICYLLFVICNLLRLAGDLVAERMFTLREGSKKIKGPFSRPWLLRGGGRGSAEM